MLLPGAGKDSKLAISSLSFITWTGQALEGDCNPQMATSVVEMRKCPLIGALTSGQRTHSLTHFAIVCIRCGADLPVHPCLGELDSLRTGNHADPPY